MSDDHQAPRPIRSTTSCVSCHTYQEVEVALRSLKVQRDQVVLPAVKCLSCGEEARVITEPSDYFIFLTSD